MNNLVVLNEINSNDQNFNDQNFNNQNNNQLGKKRKFDNIRNENLPNNNNILIVQSDLDNIKKIKIEMRKENKNFKKSDHLLPHFFTDHVLVNYIGELSSTGKLEKEGRVIFSDGTVIKG